MSVLIIENGTVYSLERKSVTFVNFSLIYCPFSIFLIRLSKNALAKDLWLIVVDVFQVALTWFS